MSIRADLGNWSLFMAATVLLAACSGDALLATDVNGSVVSPSTTAAPAAPECSAADDARSDNVRSYPPLSPLPTPNAMPAGSTMAAIQDRGRIIVGVSGDTLLFGARNPLTGELEGFDIDMANEIATAIFGDDLEGRIEYRVINNADRLPALEARSVDMVARTMTINCKRWLRIAFSAEYFASGQKVLVKVGSEVNDVDQLSAEGARVCAPLGSTNIDEITKSYQGIVVVGRPETSDCLVALQLGQADAITGDDTVLAGFAAQDPNTKVVGKAFTKEPYGLGFNADDVDFVQFANAIIEEMRADGRWDAIYQRWLIDTGALPPADPPVGDHSRPLP